ncbi:EndoU domain-containing protein [Glycomyces mayteni]|uniref:EndoU domain-containing protein n=1 Tax=Glycomyces mayteni TaxID=543887 RepID=A0ABW2DDU0_9ACTN|nr:hypothetical protein GCM10025732_03220 [Glycomyces mayteni]
MGTGKKSGGKLISAALEFFQKAKKQRAGRAQQNKMDYDKLQHALVGDVRPGRPSGSGYHWRPGGNDFDGRRIRPDSKRPVGDNGVYQADPEFFDAGPPPIWKPKGGNGGTSTFFPDSWTGEDVDKNIATAFRKSQPHPTDPNMWVGESGGVKISGYYDGNNGRGYTHGFPSDQQ